MTLNEEDVKTDMTGPYNPAEVQWMGEQAIISFDLVRYDQAVAERLMGRTPGSTAYASAGTYAMGSMGGLMVAEGFTTRLLIYSPYSAKAAFSGMPSCYNFLLAWPSGPIDFGLSTRVKRKRMLWRAIPQVNWTNGDQILYNHDSTGIVAVS